MQPSVAAWRGRRVSRSSPIFFMSARGPRPPFQSETPLPRWSKWRSAELVAPTRLPAASAARPGNNLVKCLQRSPDGATPSAAALAGRPTGLRPGEPIKRGPWGRGKWAVEMGAAATRRRRYCRVRAAAAGSGWWVATAVLAAANQRSHAKEDALPPRNAPRIRSRRLPASGTRRAAKERADQNLGGTFKPSRTSHQRGPG